MRDQAAWKVEEQRQAQLLTDAIQKAIADTAKEFGGPPILNALAGALVMVTGGMLAGIDDLRVRKALRQTMMRELPAAIARTLVKGRVQLLNLADKLQ